MAGRRQNRLQNKKHFRILFGRMQWVMLLFFLMIAILIIERRNIVYSSADRNPDILDQSVFTEEVFEKEPECLVIWDSSVAASVGARQQMYDVLTQMRISFEEQDMAINSALLLSPYENVVIALDDYDVFGEQIFDLFDAVEI